MSPPPGSAPSTRCSPGHAPTREARPGDILSSVTSTSESTLTPYPERPRPRPPSPDLRDRQVSRAHLQPHPVPEPLGERGTQRAASPLCRPPRLTAGTQASRFDFTPVLSPTCAAVPCSPAPPSGSSSSDSRCYLSWAGCSGAAPSRKPVSAARAGPLGAPTAPVLTCTLPLSQRRAPAWSPASALLGQGQPRGTGRVLFCWHRGGLARNKRLGTTG